MSRVPGKARASPRARTRSPPPPTVPATSSGPRTPRQGGYCSASRLARLAPEPTSPVPRATALAAKATWGRAENGQEGAKKVPRCHSWTRRCPLQRRVRPPTSTSSQERSQSPCARRMRGWRGRTRGSTGAISHLCPRDSRDVRGWGWPWQDAASARPGLSWANATLTPIPWASSRHSLNNPPPGSSASPSSGCFGFAPEGKPRPRAKGRFRDPASAPSRKWGGAGRFCPPEARGWGRRPRAPRSFPGPRGVRGPGSRKGPEGGGPRGPVGGRGQRVGPAPVTSREARTGRGYQAARPPHLVPPPLPRFLAAPRPGPVCAAALGPGTAPPPHPREPRAARGESEAPASPRACGPLPTAPPPGPLPAPDSAHGGVARLPRARAPGCFPFPSPWPWPPWLRRLLLRRRRSEQAGGRMDGAGGPGEGPAQEALQSLSRRLQVQEKEMELVKAALAEALRLLRLQAPSTSLQDPGTLGPPRDSPAAPPGLPPTCSPSLVSRGTQTEAEMEVEPSPGPPGLSNGPPAPPGGSEEPSGTQSEGGGSSSSGTGSPGPPGILRLAQPPQRTDTPRRNSSSSSPSERPRQKLSRKAASSANLLLRSGSTESRGGKDPLSSPGGPGSRRSNYNLEGISVKMFLRGRPITMYIPSGIRSLEELPSGPPPETLSLDWVYGYRGRDSRSNLFVLRSGEVVYFIACVVVLYRPGGGPGGPGGGGQRHYRGHTDCVRCLAVHPDGVRVASGQTAGVDKDGKPLQPVVHVWDSETLLKLQEIGLGAFERGVGALAFSVADQGAFLCVVDDSNEHMLSVWDCSRGTKLAEIKSTNDSVLAVGFNPRDSSSIVTSGKSHVHFWNWNGGTGVPGNGTLTRKQGVFGKYKKPKFIPCFVFLPDGDILTGDSEGNILTWGRSLSDSRTPGRGGAKETYGIVAQAHAHEGSIFALCLRRDGTVLSGGGRDRRLVQWGPGLVALQEAEIPEHFGAVRAIAEGPGSELLVGTTKNALLRGDLAQGFSPVIQGHTDELWGLCTHPFQNRFLTCGHDRQLCLWDGEGHALAWSIDLKETGLCADFHPSGAVVAVGLNTGRWLVLDTETREIVSDITDGNEQLSVVRYSPDGLYLAIGSHDNMIYIYSVSSDGAKSSRFGRCVGHSSFITHLDWSKDGNFIMSNSGDYEILYWDVAGGCKLLRNRYESRDREWATYTCVLGFHVYGVWPDGSDGTDINSLCRSHNERVVAVADDFCKVHLFQYPCAHAKAPSLVYGGHGSHVTSVRFTHDDSHLISLGGKDASIFQWRVLGAGGTGPVPTTPSRTPSLSPASSLDV